MNKNIFKIRYIQYVKHPHMNVSKPLRIPGVKAAHSSKTEAILAGRYTSLSPNLFFPAFIFERVA
jgi:hypothetical protein